jgi:GT2 family glycosyltransferase
MNKEKNKMSWFRFIICSKSVTLSSTKAGMYLHNEFLNEKACFVDFYGDNTLGLSNRYNEAINKAIEKAPLDTILIFMHDDVLIEDFFFFEKLEEALNKYDIVGLAGTKNWSLKSPAVWNNSPREAWSGAVAHTKDNEIWMTSFGNFGQVLILDGLFLAVKLETLKKHNLRFDEQFTFHFYDIDFTLQAYQKKLKCGTTPIWVTHHSIGDWTKDQVWPILEKKFIAKWKL